MVHHLLLAGVEATLISKQEVSDGGLLQLCSSLQAPEVELSAVVSPVSDSIRPSSHKGISQQGRGCHTEQRRSENAASFHIVRNWKGATVKLWDDRYELAGTAKRLRFCLLYRRPCSSQLTSQRGRYVALSIFSWSWRAANIMLVVPRSERKPHWLSGRRPCSKCWMRRFSRMPANILSAIDRR